jgi:hypothetical protein
LPTVSLLRGRGVWGAGGGHKAKPSSGLVAPCRRRANTFHHDPDNPRRPSPSELRRVREGGRAGLGRDPGPGASGGSWELGLHRPRGTAALSPGFGSSGCGAHSPRIWGGSHGSRRAGSGAPGSCATEGLWCPAWPRRVQVTRAARSRRAATVLTWVGGLVVPGRPWEFFGPSK